MLKYLAIAPARSGCFVRVVFWVLSEPWPIVSVLRPSFYPKRLFLSLAERPRVLQSALLRKPKFADDGYLCVRHFRSPRGGQDSRPWISRQPPDRQMRGAPYSSRRSLISSPRERSRSITISQCIGHNSIWRTWRPAASTFSATKVARRRQVRALHGETYPHRWMQTAVGAGSKLGCNMSGWDGLSSRPPFSAHIAQLRFGWPRGA